MAKSNLIQSIVHDGTLIVFVFLIKLSIEKLAFRGRKINRKLSIEIK